MGTLIDVWHTLTRPGDYDLIARLKWVFIVSAVMLLACLWIGQQVLANSRAYYPRERFGLALSWSLVIVAFVLAVMVSIGWLMGGITAWVGLAVHLAFIAVALVCAILLMPAKPGWRRRQP